MDSQSFTNGDFEKLRKKAEELVSQLPAGKSASPTGDIYRLIHDLQVHQIELELQNEELKLTQLKLQDTVELYASLYNQAPVGYVTLDKHSIIVQCNETFCQMVGLPHASIRGKSLSEFIKEPDRQLFKGRFNAIYKSPEGKTMVVRLAASRRKPISVHLSARAEKAGNHAEAGYAENYFLFLTISDITTMTQAQQSLKENEDRLRVIFEMNATAIMILDQDSKISMTNAAFTHVSGYPAAEVRSMSWTELVHPEEVPMLSEYDRMRKIDPASIPDSYEFRFIRKDGAIRIGLMHISLIPKTGEVLCAIIDITGRKEAEDQIRRNAEELKKREQQLQELNTTKDKFFSIIAHDLKSPFNSFLGLTQMIEKNSGSFTITELLHTISLIRKSASNLYELLENLLEWALLQRGSTRLIPENLNVKMLVDSVITHLQESANLKHLKLILEVPPALRIHADRYMTEAILRNLIANAIKFTHQEGTVTITASEMAGGFAEIRVSDTGIGMKPEMIEGLFKLEANTSRRGTDGEPSSGLGLILCREFVEMNNGTIAVESEPGKGSIFSITLPQRSASHPSPPKVSVHQDVKS